MTHTPSLNVSYSSRILFCQEGRDGSQNHFLVESSSSEDLPTFFPKTQDLALSYLFDNPLSWHSFSPELKDSPEIKKGAYLAGYFYKNPILTQGLLEAEQEETPLRKFALLIQRNSVFFEASASGFHACSLRTSDLALKTERVVASLLVHQNGLMLQELVAFQDDEGIVWNAIQNNRHAIRFASQRLQRDSRFAMMAFHMRDEAAAHPEEGRSIEITSLPEASDRVRLSLPEEMQGELGSFEKLPQEGVAARSFRLQDEGSER